MKKRFFFSVAVLVAGCASASPHAATVAIPTPSAGMLTPPFASTAPPAPTGALEMSFGLPDIEDWKEGDRHDPHFAGWTPDMVLHNDKLGAVLAFMGVPRTLGSPLELASAMSLRFKNPSVVMGDAEGRRASFLSCTEYKRSGMTCGKVFVIMVDGDRQQNVLIIGSWPPRSNDVALRDIDEVARTIRAAPAK